MATRPRQSIYSTNIEGHIRECIRHKLHTGLRSFGLLPLPHGWQVRRFDTVCENPRVIVTEGPMREGTLIRAGHIFAQLVRPDGAEVHISFVVSTHIDAQYNPEDYTDITFDERFVVRHAGSAGQVMTMEQSLPDKESVMVALLAMGVDYV